jgi:hypothetical protein
MSSRSRRLFYSHGLVNMCCRFSLHSFDWNWTRLKRAFRRHQYVTQQLHFQQWQHRQRGLNKGHNFQLTGASGIMHFTFSSPCIRLSLKCEGTQAETRFRLPAKRTSPFKSAWASVQSTIRSRVVCISNSNAGYNMFRGSVKRTGYTVAAATPPD